MVDLALIPAGMAAQRLLARTPDEPIVRGLARQAAWRMARTGAGAVALTAAQAAAECLDQRVRADGRIAQVPVALPAGVALAVVLDRIRRSDRPKHGRGSAGLRGDIAVARRLRTRRRGARRLRRPRPRRGRACGYPTRPSPAGLTSMVAPNRPRRIPGLLALASGTLFDHVVRGLEEGATAFEPLLDESVEPDWIGTTVSGGPGSAVPWATLGEKAAATLSLTSGQARSTTGRRACRTSASPP